MSYFFVGGEISQTHKMWRLRANMKCILSKQLNFFCTLLCLVLELWHFSDTVFSSYFLLHTAQFIYVDIVYFYGFLVLSEPELFSVQLD